PGERQRALDLAGDPQVPGRDVDLRHRAGVQHRPLLGQVLAGRQAGRVVAGLDHLGLRLRSEQGHVPRLTRVLGVSLPAVARRPRAFVRVAGPDAEDYLQRMLSNDVEALAAGESCGALLLTPKARLVAPLRVWRRGPADFLPLTEPERGEVV